MVVWDINHEPLLGFRTLEDLQSHFAKEHDHAPVLMGKGCSLCEVVFIVGRNAKTIRDARRKLLHHAMKEHGVSIIVEE